VNPDEVVEVVLLDVAAVVAEVVPGVMVVATVVVCAAAWVMPTPPRVTATAAIAAADQRRTVPGDVERVGFIVGAFPVVGVSTMAFRARGHLCRLRAVRMGLLSVSCAPVCRPLHRSAGTPRSQDSGVGHGHGANQRGGMPVSSRNVTKAASAAAEIASEGRVPLLRTSCSTRSPVAKS